MAQLARLPQQLRGSEDGGLLYLKAGRWRTQLLNVQREYNPLYGRRILKCIIYGACPQCASSSGLVYGLIEELNQPRAERPLVAMKSG